MSNISKTLYLFFCKKSDIPSFIFQKLSYTFLKTNTFAIKMRHFDGYSKWLISTNWPKFLTTLYKGSKSSLRLSSPMPPNFFCRVIFFTYILSILLLNDVSWNFNGNKIVLTEKNWLQKILLHKMAARRRLKIVSCRFLFVCFFSFLSEMCSLIKLVDRPPRSQTLKNRFLILH